MLVDILKEDEQGNVYVLREPGGLTVEWHGKSVTVPYEFRTALPFPGSSGDGYFRRATRGLFAPRSYMIGFTELIRTGGPKRNPTSCSASFWLRTGCRSVSPGERTGACVCSVVIPGIMEGV